MSWKFWEKDKSAVGFSGCQTLRIDKPIELPQEVGLHLVVEQGLDPDWVWGLKCVKRPSANSDSAFNIRIFCPQTVAQHAVEVRDYASLDNCMDLVLYAGWYDSETRSIQLAQLIQEAV